MCVTSQYTQVIIVQRAHKYASIGHANADIANMLSQAAEELAYSYTGLILNFSGLRISQ